MKKFIPIFLFLLSSGVVYSQQDPLLSQYMFNKMIFNPAYAGSREVLTIDAIYRNQWTGINGAPKTLNLSVHSPLNNPHIGVGGYVYTYTIGPVKDQGVMGNFVYRLLLGNNAKLAFGLQVGLKNYDVDWNMLTYPDAGDPVLKGQLKQKIRPDANFGIYFYNNRFYAGVASKQLFMNDFTVQNNAGTFAKLSQHFYGMAGVAIPLSDNVVFRPSTLVKYVKNAPLQADVNASFLFMDTFWAGVSYRTEKAVSFMVDFSLTPSLRLGYAYDLWFNELQHYAKGSHEVRLSLDLNVLKSRMLTPRYF